MLIENMLVRLSRSPRAMRAGLDVLALRGPVVPVGKALWVLSAAGVREVLARPHDFLTAKVYTPRIKIDGGPCLLGVDPSPAYDREHAALWYALANSDAPAAGGGGVDPAAVLDPRQIARKFEAVLEQEYAQAAREVAAAGVVDIGGLIERTLVRSFARFYGVDPDAAHSDSVAERPGTDTLAHWLRKVGSLIALPTPAPWGFEADGTRLGAEFSAFLLDQAERTRPAQPPQFSSLMANLRAGTTLSAPADIARCVGVLMLAGTTTIKATTLALHELLSRPFEGARAIHAAQRGDEREVFAYAQEALRFRPVFPFLGRYCPRPTILGEGTPFETKIAAGTELAISPMRAMFDPEAVQRPGDFIVGRPARVYLHFGHELQHTCIGKHLASCALSFVLTRLLAERVIRAGKIKYDGAAVLSYSAEQQLFDDGRGPAAIPDYAARIAPDA